MRVLSRVLRVWRLRKARLRKATLRRKKVGGRFACLFASVLLPLARGPGLVLFHSCEDVYKQVARHRDRSVEPPV